MLASFFMAQPTWDTERVRKLLVRAREFTGVSQGRILGAKLGKLLRSFDRAFYPGVLGDKRLVALLKRYPDLGTIELAEQDFVFQFFVDGGVTRRQDPANTQVSLPSLDGVAAKPAPAQVEQDQGSLPGIEPGNTWVNHDLWLALVAEHAPAVYVDLQTLGLVSEQEGAAQVSAEPERFVRVPPIPQDELQRVAREFAAAQTDAQVREALAGSAEGASWFREFTKRAEEFGLSTKWLSVHRSYVLSRARQWFVDHGIKPERFIMSRSRPPSARQTAAPSVTAPAKSLGGVRRIVHSAIDRMSDDELLNLSIPLRYLFPK